MMKTAGPLLTAIALLVCPLVAPKAGATTSAESAEQLRVAFFTAGFLAEIASRIETARTEAERLAGGYLEEKTELIWATRDNGADVDWYAAGDFCRDLEVADWSDWRMPTIEELEGLHEPRSSGLYKLTSAIQLTACCPWSETRSGDTSAWNFSFRYRKRFSGDLNYSYQLRALCVRPATAADLLFYEEAAAAAKEAKKKKKKS
jgi:hypothetical protein